MTIESMFPEPLESRDRRARHLPVRNLFDPVRAAASARTPFADLGGHLRRVCAGLVAARRVGDVAELSLAIADDCFAPPDAVASIGLIVGEAVTNAIKYAHPAGVRGRIGIACRRDLGASILIEITDDGVGLPEGFDPAIDGGFGFSLMRELGERLGASVAFVSTGLGLRVRLRTPRFTPNLHLVGEAGFDDDPAPEDRRFGELLDALPVAVYTQYGLDRFFR